ncbi:flagellar biosynthesis protein FlhA [Alicyclobacillus sp. TC]|uniref:Flagellar biosynthesis protein FlhA n=2 Tax=Alicyclobacillaceae TaxID=186823 RepID=A0ABT9LX82_9BACL|nr:MULTISPECIES: flagellar biosynthesis protein FlhA [Alicyclobacillus]MDP9728862.1 flagellar biosynthesis protein FlhA [Alicyclobacillus tengchongensis]QRF23704.1 flagellar biosynthesis protein FlhA [Alicyclobacillus sp. TC]
MKRSDLGIMAALLWIIVMMIIPMSRPVLDVLLLVNIFVSMTILLVAINTKEPLDFSVFPSILLIMTLYRLSLNISTTRLILGQGNAGAVINTFGSFVIGSNPVVGFIVFIIIIIVQFIVITRGAERVAEVAARFTLDAMPGKQIAIDADLNAGLIDEATARKRRADIEREADFYGAMDGASKFVKGDAIASMLIVAVNIVGGFIIGMVIHKDSFSTALHQYTLLSVGDGLVSQIPALLLSTATGLMVTRAATEANLGADIFGQVFQFPRALYMVGSAILLLGVFTPIGVIPVIPISALAFLTGWRVQVNAARSAKKEQEQLLKSRTEDNKKPENALSLLHVEPIELEFGYGLVPLVDAKQGGDMLERVIMIRKQLALELGLVIPAIRLRDNMQLKPTEYVILLKGLEIARGEVLLGHWLAISPGVEDPTIIGISTKEPTFGLPALWVNSEMKIQAEMSGYTVVDPSSVMATHLTETLRAHAHELLTRQETKKLLDHLKTEAPAVVDDVLNNNLTLGQVQKVLSNLLHEKVSIRDLSTILEVLADVGRQSKDTDMLTEQVRQALGRQICHQFRVPGQPLTVLTFSPSVEEKIQESLIHQEESVFVALDPALSQKIYKKLREESNRLSAQGKSPILLVHPTLRLAVRRWLVRFLPELTVLSYSELDPTLEVESGGVVNL